MRCRAADAGGAARDGRIVGGRIDEVGTAAGHVPPRQRAGDFAPPPYGGGVPRALEGYSTNPAPQRGGVFLCQQGWRTRMKAEVNERESFEQVTGRFPPLDEHARPRAADRTAAGEQAQAAS